MPPKKPAPGNPLWIKWLKEWQKEYEDAGNMNPAKGIKKAIASLEKCPVPMNHPTEAHHISYIGEKTIKYLTTRMQAHSAELGVPMPEIQAERWEETAAKAAKKRKKKDDDLPPGAHRLGNGKESDSDDDMTAAERKRRKDAGLSSSPRKVNTSPPKKKGKAKPYAPRLRSGAYALFIGLAAHGSDAWVTQEEIVALGDPFFGQAGNSLLDVDKSRGGQGNYGYSGWSSMNGTLIKQGYAEKKGRAPIKYNITALGWKIACKAIRNAKRNGDFDVQARLALPELVSDDSDAEDEEGDEPPKNKGKGKAAPQPAEQPARRSSAASQVIRRESSGGGASIQREDDRFLFFYVNDDGQRTTRKREAQITMDPNTFTSVYLIEFRKFQAKHPFCDKNVGERMPVYDDDGNPGRTCSGLLPEKYALDKAPGFDDPAPVPPPPSASKAIVKAAPQASKKASRPPSDSEDNEPPKKTRKQPAAIAQSSVAGPSNSLPAAVKPTFIDLSDSDDGNDDAGQPESSNLVQKKSSAASTTYSVPAARPARVQQAGPSETRASDRSVDLPNVRDIKCVTMEPGTYEIVLILDEREKPGLSTKKITSTMSRNDVEWDTRTLSVGDAIWIARDPISKLEVVLDCCLERKRIDDLEASLKDGRYAEQKNRMKNSGITRLMYLIEETEKKKNAESAFGTSIATLKSQMQVVDGFKVQIVSIVPEACSYLSSLTRALIETHKHKTLHVLPNNIVNRDTYLDLIDELRTRRPATSFFITYEAYQNINTKVHNVSSGWAKMIASIDQMSLERTSRFLDRFPCPADFFEELEEAQEKNAEEAASMDPAKRGKKNQASYGDCWIMRSTLSEQETATAVRPIGQALSTACWNLFTQKKY